jgi:hypothetical protein
MALDRENHPKGDRSDEQPAPSGGPSPDAGATDPLAALAQSLADLRFEVWRLAHAKWDLAKLGLRNRLVWLGAWVGGLIAAMAIGVAAGVLAMYGLALWIAERCGDRLWLGYMAAGLIGVFGVALGLVSLEFYFRSRVLRGMEITYARTESRSTPDPAEAAGTGA